MASRWRSHASLMFRWRRDLLHYMAGWASKIEGNTIPFSPKYFAYTRREPVAHHRFIPMVRDH